jgi:hypothetical protein
MSRSRAGLAGQRTGLVCIREDLESARSGSFQLGHDHSPDRAFMGMGTPRSAATCSARS